MNKIPYGLDLNGVLVNVDQVKNGKSCNCVCPDCKTPLIASNGGKKQVHHFKHISNVDSCNAGETILHLLSKIILTESKYLRLPSITYGKNTIEESKAIYISNVELEKKIDNFIPDIIVTSDDNLKYLIEIKVTHGIDDDKLLKLKEKRLPVLEIDVLFLKNVFDYKIVETELKESLIDSVKNKSWIFHPGVENFKHTHNTNKYKVATDLIGDKYIFKDINSDLEVYPFDKRLAWKTSLSYLWKFNRNKPFIAINKKYLYAKRKNRTCFYFADKPVNNKAIGYRCEMHNDINFFHESSSFVYKCDIDCYYEKEYTKEFFNIYEYDWYFIQDKPDKILRHKDIRNLEIQKNINETKKMIQSNIQYHDPMTLIDVCDFHNKYKTISARNVETLDIVEIINRELISEKYSFNDKDKVWIAIFGSIYTEEFFDLNQFK